MNDNARSAHEQAAIQRMLWRLDEFAQELGLDEAATRQIVERVASDMPMRSDEEQVVEARARMIEASA